MPPTVLATPVLTVLYGGTFDPVHNGHLGVARHARDALRAQVRLMPAADPPHKGPTHADAGQRARMLALAVACEPGLGLDLRELERDGPSYTVDTLHALRAEVGPDASWAILVGADSFLAIETWHRWRELFALAHVVVAQRAAAGAAVAEPVRDRLTPALAAATEDRWTTDRQVLHAEPAGRVLALHQPLFPESASALRLRIGRDQPWRHLVPPPVADYIHAHGLYRRESGPGGR